LRYLLVTNAITIKTRNAADTDAAIRISPVADLEKSPDSWDVSFFLELEF
jgi:hypothetical protein